MLLSFAFFNDISLKRADICKVKLI